MQEVAEGEKAEGLLPVLAWQPNGRHLYAAQQDAQGQRVILYELNGLQHGNFEVSGPGEAPPMCQQVSPARAFSWQCRRRGQ